MGRRSAYDEPMVRLTVQMHPLMKLVLEREVEYRNKRDRIGPGDLAWTLQSVIRHDILDRYGIELPDPERRR